MVLIVAVVGGAGADRAHATGQPDHVDRRRAVDIRAVAQLTHGVGAPALGRTGARHSARVVAARADRGHPARQADHVDRRRAVGGSAIAELTSPLVGAPALDRAAARQRAGVVAADGDRGHPAREAADVDRRQAGVFDRAVAELTIRVVAPALDRAAARQRARVAVAVGVDRDHPAGEPHDVDRRRAVVGRAVAELTPVAPALDRADPARQADHVDRRGAVGGSAVAELTIGVVAPALDRPGGRHRTREVAAGADRDHPAGQALDADRPGAVGRRAVAELTIFVGAPALDPAGARHRTRVEVARAQRLRRGRRQRRLHNHQQHKQRNRNNGRGAAPSPARTQPAPPGPGAPRAPVLHDRHALRDGRRDHRAARSRRVGNFCGCETTVMGGGGEHFC